MGFSMKKLVIIIALLAAIAVKAKDTTIVESNYDGILSLMVGYNEDRGGLGGGIQWRGKYVGAQFVSIGKSADLPEYNDYEIPHNNYDVVEYHKPALSLELVLSLPAGEGMTFVGSLGYYWQEIQRLAQSNVTYDYYEYDSKIEDSGLSYSIATQFNHSWWMAGCGYHSLVGPFLTVGYVWR